MHTTDDDSTWRSQAYTEPADRPTEWARMAAELAADGRTIPDIAVTLCVDEPTAATLLGVRLLERAA